MPGSRKSKRITTARRRKSRVLPLVLTLILAISAFFGWMACSAHTCHLCMAEVYLADLPAQMDGVTILFLSDINLKSSRDAVHASRLLTRLNALRPDILLLGGDYCTQNAFELLNSTQAPLPDCLQEFSASLAGFSAPLGKFAVLGEKDADEAKLTQIFASAGVACLCDSSVQISKDGAAFSIAGLRDSSQKQTPYTKIASGFSKGDCVIAVSHNPDAYAEIRTAEAADSGAWADLVLSGHTLGGQIWLFGRSLRGEKNDRHSISGWQHANDVPLLISQGLGCEGMQLRLGSRSEVWLITLKRQQPF